MKMLVNHLSAYVPPTLSICHSVFMCDSWLTLLSLNTSRLFKRSRVILILLHRLALLVMLITARHNQMHLTVIIGYFYVLWLIYLVDDVVFFRIVSLWYGGSSMLICSWSWELNIVIESTFADQVSIRLVVIYQIGFICPKRLELIDRRDPWSGIFELYWRMVVDWFPSIHIDGQGWAIFLNL